MPWPLAMRSLLRYVSILCLTSCPLPAHIELWHLDKAGIPKGLEPAAGVQPIVIAIVDDGVRTHHEEVRSFIWQNEGEVPGNGVDDDGNGFVDDLNGWDLGDGDPDVNPPSHRLEEFYHGTHLAGIIAQVAREVYGKQAQEHIRLMPVKCLADESPRLFLQEAFDGIAYAMDNGADIILCSWGLNVISDRDTQVLDKAMENDCLVIAASGSFDEEKQQFPAAHPAAMAVSGHDFLGRKQKNATYGAFVDLMAPAEDIHAASSLDDMAHLTKSGTSQAAAIVAASAAILKLQRPDYSNAQIRAALMNSATSTTQNPGYTAKLGTGKLNLGRALQNGPALDSNRILKSKGIIPVNLGIDGDWTVGPLDHVSGFRLQAWNDIEKDASGQIMFYSPQDASKPKHTHLLKDLPPEVYLPGNAIAIRYEPDAAASGGELLLGFAAEPIDLSSLYCSGTKRISEAGVLEDGSGFDPYSPASDCKWLISAPPGKVIRFNFLEFEIEPMVDKIYFFNGSHTNAPIMAILTGTVLPEDLITWSNEALIWFVTDRYNQGQGWKIAFEFIDP